MRRPLSDELYTYFVVESEFTRGVDCKDFSSCPLLVGTEQYLITDDRVRILTGRLLTGHHLYLRGQSNGNVVRRT